MSSSTFWSFLHFAPRNLARSSLVCLPKPPLEINFSWSATKSSARRMRWFLG